MADEPEPDPVESSEDVGELRREAAKHRRERRQAEQERDQLVARLDASDRREVERLAAEHFVDPTDVWAVLELDQLRDDDGLNVETVQARFTEVAEKKPHWKKPTEPEPTNHRVDLHQGARRSAPELPSFGQALKRRE